MTLSAFTCITCLLHGIFMGDCSFKVMGAYRDIFTYPFLWMHHHAVVTWYCLHNVLNPYIFLWNYSFGIFRIPEVFLLLPQGFHHWLLNLMIVVLQLIFLLIMERWIKVLNVKLECTFCYLNVLFDCIFPFVFLLNIFPV